MLLGHSSAHMVIAKHIEKLGEFPERKKKLN